MNPAALKTNIGDLPPGGALIVNSDAFTQQNLNKAGYASQPARPTARSRPTRVFEIPISTLNARALDGLDMTSQAGRPDQELLRPRAHVLAVRAEHGADARLDRREVRRPAGRRRGEQAGAQGRLRVRRDDRDLPHPLPRRAGPPRARHVPQHHRQRGDGARLRRRLAARRAGRSSTAPTRSRRPATSCTSSPATRRSASRRSRPRTRSPPSGRPSARPTAARSALTASSGPGIALKTEAMGLAVMVELPLVVVDVQRAGPSTGHADEDRAGRPAPGDVRAQRGLAAADRRAGHARASASTWPSRPAGSPSST